jgi:predicted kinase
MARIILTRGLPACGKTTWTREYVAQNKGTTKRIAKDDLRMMFDGHHEFGVIHEHFVNDIRDGMIETCLHHHFDVVLDETFARHADLHWLCDHYLYAEIIVVEFNVATEECIRRDALRERPLGVDVIRDYERVFREEDSRCSSTQSLRQKVGRFIEGTNASSMKLDGSLVGSPFSLFGEKDNPLWEKYAHSGLKTPSPISRLSSLPTFS